MARQARLRNDAAALYPYLPPGTWRTAAELADNLLASLLRHPGACGPIWRVRLLPEEHFEFRGRPVRPSSDPALRTRRQEW
jgi:hypothetical protein